MNGDDHGNRQRLDAVEQLQRLPDHGLDLRLGGEAGEFADVGADQEAGGLAAHDDEALDLPARGGRPRPN